MDQVDIPGQWIIDSFRRNQEEAPMGDQLGTFGILGTLYDFYRSSRHRVCDRTPSSYRASGILADWGIPAERYGVTRPEVHEMVASQVDIHNRGNISLAIGRASSQIDR